MLNTLATLGVGLLTAIATPAAAAYNDCGPSHPSSTYPYPSYGAPAPTYAPAPAPTYAPAPVFMPGPTYSVPTVEMRRADYNNDGAVTRAEAHAYARGQFSRTDVDRNGVLTRREVESYGDDIARSSRGRDWIVTRAEYEASVQNRFIDLDRNRDGFLSRHELGLSAAPPQNGVSVSWHWKL
jgi:hypothetical protein